MINMTENLNQTDQVLILLVSARTSCAYSFCEDKTVIMSKWTCTSTSCTWAHEPSTCVHTRTSFHAGQRDGLFVLMKRSGAKGCSLFFFLIWLFQNCDTEEVLCKLTEEAGAGGGSGGVWQDLETAGWESILRTRKKSIQGVSGDGKGWLELVGAEGKRAEGECRRQSGYCWWTLLWRR